MRHETKVKFDRLLRRQRLRRIGIVVAAVSAIGLALAFEDLDAHVENVRIGGQIDAVAPLVSKSAATADGLTIGVRLDDGRHIQVVAYKSRDPHVGDHIEVTEHRHWSGRVTHTYH